VGLDGYQDLQERVRTLIRAQMRSPAEPQEEGHGTRHLAETPFAASLERDVDHLLRTISALDRESLEKSVGVLASAKRIFVTGDITTYSLAYYFALAANRARGNVHLVKADGEGASRLVDIGADDAVLAFTFPPYSKMVVRVVEWAIRNGAASIGITDHAVSPVGRKVSIVLPAVTSGLGPQNTLVPAMAIGNALLNALILETEDRSLSRYKSVNRLLGEWDLFVLGVDESE